MGFRKTLSIFLLLVLSAAGFAAEEVRNARIQGAAVAVSGSVQVRDDKFPQPFTSGWDAGFAYMLNKGSVEFGLDETRRGYYAHPFEVTIVFDVTATDRYNNVQTYTGNILKINYKLTGSYNDKATYRLDGFAKLDVTITSISATDLSTSSSMAVPGELYLEAGMATTRYYTFNPSVSPVSSPAHLNYNVLGTCNTHLCTQPPCLALSDPTDIEVYWDYMPGAEEYELEWTWVNDYTGSPAAYDFRFDATRVSTTNTYYRIPLTYESGYIVYRLRPVGRTGNDFSIRAEGAWTNTADHGLVSAYPSNMTYHLAPFDNDNINWASTLTFDENGKKGSGISYMDGMLLGRQSLAKLNTDERVIAQGVVYDFQGRPAISVLPAPYDQNCYTYIANLNKDAAGSVYDKLDFDVNSAGTCVTATSPMSVSSAGAANYYSPSNTDKSGAQGNLPDAAGRPFVQVEYMDDMTGRIKSQTMPGEAHQLNSGRETKFYYSNPGSEELISLFGSEVGNAAHYDKNIVKDANGQLSVSYLDMEGRVVATALLGAKPSSVDTIADWNSNVSYDDNLVLFNKSDPDDHSYTSTKGFFVEQPLSTQTFTYEFMPADFTDACAPSLCFDCIYEMSISITDACHNSLFSHSAVVGNALPHDGSCESSPVKFSLAADVGSSPVSVTFNDPGNYFVTKTLRVSDIGLDDYVKLYIDNNTCFSYAAILQGQLDAVDPTLCNTDCASCLASVSSYTAAHAGTLSEAQIADLVADCENLCADQLDPCADLREEMLQDFYPGGQYAGYTIDPATGAYSFSDNTSVLNSGNALGLDYTGVTFLDGSGNPILVSVIRSGAPALVAVSQLTKQEYIQYFKPEWAAFFLDHHPEKCYLDFCEANKASQLYDDAMLQINTYDEAYQKGYLKPLSGITLPSGICGAGTMGSANLDPFFTATGIGVTQNLNTFVSNSGSGYVFADEWGTSISGNSNYKDLMMLAYTSEYPVNEGSTATSSKPMFPLMMDMAYGGSPGTAVMGCDACAKDKEWLIYRSLYLTLKKRLVLQAQTDYVVKNGCFNGCVQNSGLPSFVASGSGATSLNFIPYVFGSPVSGATYADPLFSFSAYPINQTPYAAMIPAGNYLYNGYAASQPSLSHYSTCASGSPFTGKTAHFLQTPVSAASLTNYYNSDPTASTPSPFASTPGGMASACASTCLSYTVAWIDKLKACNPAFDASSGSYNASLVSDVAAGLAEVCEKGCDAANPFGSSTTPAPITGTGPGHFDSFYEVLTYYYAAYSISGSGPNCSSLNLDFPEPYGHDYSGSAGGAQNKLDTCGCNKVLLLKEQFAAKQTAGTLPPGVSTIEDYFSYVYHTPVTNFKDLDCKCSAVSGNSWSHTYAWSGEQSSTLLSYTVPVPEVLSCSKCLPCSTVVSQYNVFVSDHSGHESDVNYNELMENYLNGVLNMNLTAEDYMDFVRACGSSESIPPTTNVSASQVGDFLEEYVSYFQTNGLNVCGNTLTSVTFPSLFTASMDPLYPGNSTASLHCLPTNTNPADINHMSFYFPGYSDVGTTCTLTLEALPTITSFSNFHVSSVSFSVPYPQSATYNFMAGVTYDDNSGGHHTATIYGYYSCLNSEVIIRNRPLVLCNQPYEPVAPIYDDCLSSMIDQAHTNASLIYQSYVDKYTAQFKKSYRDYCYSHVSETYKRHYSLNEYHYTLYYYDQAGSLMRTVAPKGVHKLGATDIALVEANTTVYPSHTYVTNYAYQGYGAPINSKTPDEDATTQYYYDNIGRIKLSQNAQQASDGTYSYTIYDDLGRIRTVGLLGSLPSGTTLSTLQGYIAAGTLDAYIASPPSGVTRTQVIKTYYDQPLSNSIASQFGGSNPNYGQVNLRNRVASVSYEDSDDNNDLTYTYATHYTYDWHGNVSRLVQDVPELQNLARRFSKIDYSYELISGNVNQVTYQPGQADQFMHRYEYDADNRLHDVYTSKDGVNWDRDAKYFYYEHGPLARTELGDQQVQGTDYAYTIHGWIKAVNSNILASNADMGKDGARSNAYMSNYADLHRYTAKDAAGYSLNYYQQGGLVDYTAIKAFGSTTDINPLADNSANLSVLSTGSPDLYNGNISGMVTSIYDIDPDPGNTHTQGDAFPQLTAYKYDQLHRLRHMKAFRDITLSTNSWNAIGGSPNQSYKTDLVYDRNGNILSHQRKGASFVTAGLNMDNLTYGIDDAGTVPTNRLINVGEAQSSTYSTDIKATYSGATGNDYDYDKIGNLRKDNKEFISAIEWTVDRKVKRVTRDITNMIAQGKNLPDLEFEYDANRQRICKIVKPHDALGNLKDQTDWVYTYYQRDASGNITATYAKTYAFVSGHTYSETLVLNEHDIYGSARLGVYNEGVAMGTKTFTANITSGVFANVGYPVGSATPIIPCELSYTDASSGNLITVYCAGSYTRTLGDKRYELTNHLGNVITVISDRKLQNAGDGSTVLFERIFDDNDMTGVGPDPTISADPAIGGTVVNGALYISPTGAYSGVNFDFESPTTPGQTYTIEYDYDQGNTDASDNMYLLAYELDFPSGTYNNFQSFPVSNPQSGHYSFTYTSDTHTPASGDVPHTLFKLMFLSGTNTPQNTSTPHFNHYFYVDNFRVTIPNTSVQVADTYNAEILETHDYYAFGYDMPGRSVTSATPYRYGNNGQEREREEFEGAYSADYWGYDARLGRRWEIDPITYPWQSPYATFNNNPIYYSDPLGLKGDPPQKGDIYNCGDGTYEQFDGKQYKPLKGDVYKSGLIKNKAGWRVPPPPRVMPGYGIDPNSIVFVYIDKSCGESFDEEQKRYNYDVYSCNKKIGSIIVQNFLNEPALIKWFYDKSFRAVIDKRGLAPSVEVDESFGPSSDCLNDVVDASSYRAQPSKMEMMAGSLIEGAGSMASSVSAGTSYFKNVGKVGSRTQSSKANANVNNARAANLEVKYELFEETIDVYHRGELKDGKVQGKSFSTGSDAESVSKLSTRANNLYHFRIPRAIFDKWSMDGKIQTFNDYDYSTGTVNKEYRFSADIAPELNKYIVK